MGHTHDWLEQLRGWLIPKLGSVVQLLEDVTGDKYYVESETHNSQFVGRVDIDIDTFEKKLHKMGFGRNPMSALKHLSSGQKDEGSWRRVGYDGSHPDMQLHVILYDGRRMKNCPDACVYVYAHWELRWDTDPVGHYRGNNVQPAEGVRRMKDHLDQNGIGYTLERPPRQ